MGARGENKGHLQTAEDNSYPASFALWEKHELLCWKKTTFFPELVQSHLLSFVVKVGQMEKRSMLGSENRNFKKRF